MKSEMNSHHILTLLHTGVIILWTTLATAFFGTLAIAASCFSKTGESVHRVATQWAKSILWVSGIRVTVKGALSSDLSNSYIFMSNHASNFDIPVLFSSLPIQFRWLAKVELFKIPIFGAAMRGAGYISIDRSDQKSAFQSLARAAHLIRAGTSVMIFPEGTRSWDGNLQHFKKGGFVMAVDAGVPVVPIIITGTYDVMPKSRWRIERRPVSLEILEPIDTANYTRKTKEDLMDLVHKTMLSVRDDVAQGEQDA